ncbi:hypothetical protein H8356DRAFT_1704649 [Neocallimastix lanati (nom. inval.)]|jgi:hypothetical protein|uniref:Uncharacterized protein n=1 Tax=Neocallimastix californiae TaxID=1754190 RepID=A0A1Y2D2N7_9FUNG|nr:hypothetical protein H8356DRAFT_1704649 [Neocallimastix sp. JGI-2020a]ORY53376.1 hypothetical protein LY90DRAFT_670388 [Neocallimastix californiae]|eukprot:ORY53376.1 hypothetical protein LY90DRAFT_670388 [Neocallimastix californiae]
MPKQTQKNKETIKGTITKEQWYMIVGCFGYALCLIADYILELLPNGKITWEIQSSSEKLLHILEGTSTTRFQISGIMGVLSMTMIAVGLLGIAFYMKSFVPRTAIVLEIFGVSSAVMGAVFHLISTSNMWLIVRMGLSETSYSVATDFVNVHKIILIADAICYTIMSIALFIPIIMKKTVLPRWACIFNVILLTFALSPLGLSGNFSLCGLIMCLGLVVLSFIYKKPKVL